MYTRFVLLSKRVRQCSAQTSADRPLHLKSVSSPSRSCHKPHLVQTRSLTLRIHSFPSFFSFSAVAIMLSLIKYSAVSTSAGAASLRLDLDRRDGGVAGYTLQLY